MTEFALKHRTFVLVLTAVALLVGALTFLTMPRREDPELLIRTAQVVCQWPGAPAEKVDELVVDVLEGAIERIDEVDEIESKSRVGVAIISVKLDRTLAEFEQIWDELRNEVRSVEGELPDGARTPTVNSNFGDVASLCLAMYQTPLEGSDRIEHVYSDRELELYYELLERELEALPSVAAVDAFGLREERVYVEVDSAAWSKLGLDQQSLRSAIDDRNIVVSSGQLETPTGRFVLRSSGELGSLDELDDVVVGTADDGQPVVLGDVAFEVVRTVEDPARNLVRYMDADTRAPRSVLLAIEMKGGSNIVKMGEAVDAKLAELRSNRLPPDLAFAIVNDLPRQVDTLVSDFVTNLWQAIVIVLVVALFMMGWRPAVIMAAAVPLCMVVAIGVVRRFGVELEQFSIASLIISLGMIVDNAIVISDQAATLIRQGRSKFDAALEGARGLAIPVLTSTLTTVAAFLPLLTIPGESGDYMRSLPIVVSTTLLASYFVAMTITPMLCFWILKPSAKDTTQKPPGFVARLYERTIRACMKRQMLVLGGAMAAVAGAFMLVPYIGSQFFPGGVRDQFFVHVRMPRGVALEETARVVERVEDLILESRMTTVDGQPFDRLANSFAIVGSGGPRLMLTMDAEDPLPSYAHIVVNTTDATLSAEWASELRELGRAIPDARIDVRKYNLGPPVEFPVEYRISGPDADVLRDTADRVVAALRGVDGVTDPYHSWGNSSQSVDVRIDERRARLAGLTNRDVANSVNDLLSGRELTTFNEGDHSIPVVLRLARDERASLAVLDELYVGGASGKVPLDSVADVVVDWQPSQVGRVDRVRAITVGSQVDDGFLSTEVSARAYPVVEDIVSKLPAAYSFEERGEQAESSQGAADIMSAFAISFGLILLVLVSQYNSVAKPLVVLSAVPLALIGALLGLFVTGWPLGFMPSLGIVSLAGVVINNAIILIDFIQTDVASGHTVRDAVARAGQARMRPIVLTTLTTVGGLLPLALFGGPMWAGMSWAMIFGLSLSTVLTLLVVPTVFVFLVERFDVKPSASTSATA